VLRRNWKKGGVLYVSHVSRLPRLYVWSGNIIYMYVVSILNAET